MESYELLLKTAKEQLPNNITKSERFDVPKVIGHVQGNKTVISNFNQIVATLQRSQDHIVKYLQKELATPAEIDGPRLILGRKLPASLINSKIEQYAKDFLICPECKKPDTKLVKEDRFTYIKCSACGAKHPVKSRVI